MTRHRGLHPEIAERLRLDGNTAFVNIDLKACGLLVLLQELIAKYPRGAFECSDVEAKNGAVVVQEFHVNLVLTPDF